MARKPKPVQTEIESFEGQEGVMPKKDKKLDTLCDKFIELRDERAALAEQLGATETKILDRMAELKLTLHRFADQEATIKPGKPHVKIRTVKADDGGQINEPGEPQGP